MTFEQFQLWQQTGLFLCAGLGWLVLAQTNFVESKVGRALVRMTGGSWMAYGGYLFLQVFWDCGGDVPWYIYYTTGCWLN